MINVRILELIMIPQEIKVKHMLLHLAFFLIMSSYRS